METGSGVPPEDTHLNTPPDFQPGGAHPLDTQPTGAQLPESQSSVPTFHLRFNHPLAGLATVMRMGLREAAQGAMRAVSQQG